MKKILWVCVLILPLIFSCPSNSDNNNHNNQQVTINPALAFFRDNNIRAGWNLGNSFDAGDETAWGNPAVNQELMNGVKAAGFGIIRIPVTWTRYIGPAPDYVIQPARLARVAEAANMANKAGLKAIINVHHDGSSRINNSTGVLSDGGWISIRRASESETDRTAITDQIEHVWGQIAEYFKDLDDWLIFESFNEIHDGGWGWSDAFKIEAAAKAQFNVLNGWNQRFVDLVRESGGKNANRFLVIPSYVTNPECTYPGGRIPDHPVQNIGDNFKLPTDSVSDRLIVTFHYYRPESVGINGTKQNWGTEVDRKIIDRDFSPFKPHYIDKGIPVIIGECGAVRQLYPDNPAKQGQANDSRIQYMYEVFATAKKYGLIPIYWDNGSFTGSGEKFGLFNRTTGEPYNAELGIIIQTMIGAVND